MRPIQRRHTVSGKAKWARINAWRFVDGAVANHMCNLLVARGSWLACLRLIRFPFRYHQTKTNRRWKKTTCWGWGVDTICVRECVNYALALSRKICVHFHLNVVGLVLVWCCWVLHIRNMRDCLAVIPPIIISIRVCVCVCAECWVILKLIYGLSGGVFV